MENSRGKRNGAQWGLWLGLGVLGGISVYYYPLFMLSMLAVPALWAAMAFRTHPAMLLAAGGCVFLFGYLMGYGSISSLCVLGMAAPAGAMLYLCQKERRGNFQSVAYGSILLTFGMFLMFCVPDLMASGDPYVSIRAYFSFIPELFAGTGLEQTAQYLVSRVDELIVACFYAFAAGYALVNVLLLHAFNRKGDMPLCPMGPFGTWAVPYRYSMILGAASLVTTFLAMATDNPLVPALSLLLYEMWALPLMLTGANFLYALMSRRLAVRRMKGLFWVLIGSVLLFSPQFAQMALLLLGLVGIIMRRRAGKDRR